MPGIFCPSKTTSGAYLTTVSPSASCDICVQIAPFVARSLNYHVRLSVSTISAKSTTNLRIKACSAPFRMVMAISVHRLPHAPTVSKSTPSSPTASCKQNSCGVRGKTGGSRRVHSSELHSGTLQTYPALHRLQWSSVYAIGLRACRSGPFDAGRRAGRSGVRGGFQHMSPPRFKTSIPYPPSRKDFSHRNLSSQDTARTWCSSCRHCAAL